MTQEHFFGNAIWVGDPDRTVNTFSVLRGTFTLGRVRKVTLSALGLGFFKCYINGVCVNPDTFLPLSSDYEASCDPKGQVLTGHRVYVPQLDVTPFVREGENELLLHFGGGWYCFRLRPFGLPKAIYRVTAECEGGETVDFVSDRSCRIRKSSVTDYDLTRHEHRNLCLWSETAEEDGPWSPAAPVAPLVTEYCATDCPTERCIRTLPAIRIGAGEFGTVYDCGENLAGYPVLRVSAPAGEAVRVRFSEGLTENGTLDGRHLHRQEFSVVSDGTERTVQPEFTWFGFRYFEVIGDAVPECVKLVHADVPVTSTFECDNEVLNWTYRTFLHTMLCNLHTGHPSDCPHIERRGYTGDGQLTCHAVLTTLGAEPLYRKWMQDIADAQDLLSGHIPYTAPYIDSGGGPGGWGCAVVEVPYQIYRHTGDRAVLEAYYPAMRRYIDYLEAHSEFGLVTSDEAGAWCLGDWCGPNILYPEKDVTSHNQQVLLPAPMVNTYFMVKSLRTMREIAELLGHVEDLTEYDEKIDLRRRAIRAAYFNTFDGNFVMNVQGANAYAVDLGLGDATTYKNLLRYYDRLGCYDTGIFATDILTRVLFERGDADLAVTLLTGKGPQGFAHWMENGATTFHEYWDSNRSRSHSHPMFGAPVAYFFEYLLGVRQKEGSAGYRSVVIAPQAVDRFGYMKGSMQVPAGKIAIGYERTDGETVFTVTVPAGVDAVFRFGDTETALAAGTQTLRFPTEPKNA